MTERNLKSTELLRNNTAGSDVNQTIMNPPAILLRLYYWLKYSEVCLTNPKEKAACDLFYACIRDIDTSKFSYPEKLENCLSQYQNELGNDSPLYKFPALNTFNIKQIHSDFLQNAIKVRGTPITRESLTGSVINYLVNLKCMKVNKTLSVPKVIYCFLVSMSIEFAGTTTSVEKRDLVALMKKIVSVICGKDSIRKEFDQSLLSKFFSRQDNYEPMQHLKKLFDDYLANEYHLADAEIIFIASNEFKKHQVSLAKQMHTLLLILSEGGALEIISSDMARIGCGDLSLGCQKTIRSFSKDNIYSILLEESARLFRSEDESYNLKIASNQLIIPDEARIIPFIKENLIEARKQLPPRKYSILLPLLRCIKPGGTDLQLISENDQKSLEATKALFHEIATWLRKHVLLGHISCIFNVAMARKEQVWSGNSAKFIEHFMNGYDVALTKHFIPLLDRLHDYIIKHIPASEPNTHNILNIITSISESIQDLACKGIKPLKNFQAYRLKVKPVLNEVEQNLQRFFKETALHLEFLEISNDESLQNILTQTQTQTENTRAIRPENISSIHCEIKEMITNFVKAEVNLEHVYKFRLHGLDDAITIPEKATDIKGEYYAFPENEKHEVRAKFLYELLKTLQLSGFNKNEKFLKISACIEQVKNDPQKNQNFYGKRDDGIHELIDKILLFISKEALNSNISTARLLTEENSVSIVFPEITPAAPVACNMLPNKVVPMLLKTLPAREKVSTHPNSFLIVTQMEKWEKQFTQEAVNAKDRENFITFIEKMFYLNEGSFFNYITFLSSDFKQLIEYHSCILLSERTTADVAFLKELKLGCSSSDKQIQDRANKTLEELRIQNLDERIQEASTLKIHSDAKITRLKKSNVILANSSATLVWTKNRYDELEEELIGLKIAKDAARHFLKKVEERILLSNQPSSECDTAVNNYVIQLFNKMEQSTQPNVTAVYQTLLKALMVGGANPNMWLQGKLLGSNELPSKPHAKQYLVIASQAQIIITHYACRASNLGESSIFLHDKLDKIISAMDNFSKRLHSIVEADKSIFWRYGYGLFSRYQGARSEQANILFTSLELLKVMFSITELVSVDDTKKITLAKPLSEAYKRFQAATVAYRSSQDYQEVNVLENVLLRNGSYSVTRLERAITDTIDEIKALGKIKEKPLSCKLKTTDEKKTEQLTNENAQAMINIDQEEAVKTQVKAETAQVKVETAQVKVETAQVKVETTQVEERAANMLKNVLKQALMNCFKEQLPDKEKDAIASFKQRIEKSIQQTQTIDSEATTSSLQAMALSILRENTEFRHLKDYIDKAIDKKSPTTPNVIPQRLGLFSIDNPPSTRVPAAEVSVVRRL